MNNPPQNVSTRYLTNLLHNGQNNEFRLTLIATHETFVHETFVGYHYIVSITPITGPKEANAGIGATPIQALQHVLTKFGVTFK